MHNTPIYMYIHTHMLYTLTYVVCILYVYIMYILPQQELGLAIEEEEVVFIGRTDAETEAPIL